MTTSAILSIVISVGIPFVLAVLGGILAVRSLPVENFRYERWWWIGTFVGLCLLGIILAVIQQVKLTGDQQLADNKASASESQLRSDMRYTQGQLDTMTKVLSAVAFKSNETGSNKDLLQELVAVGRGAANRTPAAPVTYTNSQLKDAALDLARRI